jgi:tRNA(Leu) C34 or U34 (ribose-2'-O)-methylase TrmL
VVDTTTLDAAVDSLLAPQGEAPEQISEETVDEMIEQPVDEQDEIIEEAEDEEVIEASDDEYEEDATEYTDEVEAVDDDSEEMLYPVTINGKQERWTLSQLQQSAAGQGYIQEKMRENAEAAKQNEALRAQLVQQQNQLTTMYQQMQNGEFAAPVAPDKELLETDPIRFMQEKQAYDDAVVEYNAKMQQMQQLQQQQAQQSEAQKAQHRQEQMQLLQQRVPDFADPQKYEKAAQDMLRGGQEYYGVPQEALMSLTDAVEIEILYDAVRYRRLQANRKNVDAKAKKAKPVVKAGAKKVESGKTATRKKAQDRLRKSGSIQDALDLMLDS